MLSTDTHEQRRAPRRSAQLVCDVLSETWDEPLELAARDLSTLGVWLDSDLPLDLGDLILVSLRFPEDEEERVLSGIVRRVELHETRGCPSGMAIEFDALDDATRTSLERALSRRPPALPRRVDPSGERRALRDLMVRVTYEEHLEDRINTFEADEVVQLVEDDEAGLEDNTEIHPVALAPLLSA